MKPLPMPVADGLCTFAACYFAVLLYVDAVSHRRAFLVLAAFVTAATGTVAVLLGRGALLPLTVLLPVSAVIALATLHRQPVAPRAGQFARGVFLLLLAAALVPVWLAPGAAAGGATGTQQEARGRP